MLKITSTSVMGCHVVELHSHNDKRGDFTKIFSSLVAQQNLPKFGDICQVNVSENYDFGTIRGMHLQLPPYAENKIVTCVTGKIFDVVIDLRKDSKSYREIFSMNLSAINRRSIFIPKGCAHGFQVLEDQSSVLYLHDQEYHADLQFGYRYDDPSFAINWPAPPSIMSDRDLNYKLYEE